MDGGERAENVNDEESTQTQNKRKSIFRSFKLESFLSLA